MSEYGFAIICVLLAILLNRIRARWIKQRWLRLAAILLILLLILPALNILYILVRQRFL
jgi:hypothetical protein